MSIHQKFRGGAPVGQMDELPLLEMSVIVYFRMMASSLETDFLYLLYHHITQEV